jgi:tRNA threonylcarbamoyladenosine biosynthesis protein TsaB
MKLLAFETATEACSVALWIDGSVLERHAVAPRRHAELALPWADALLTEAGIARRELDVIACGRGPGAFTGVRLAIALTQGIALGLERPVLGISTLAALALQAAGAERVLAAIDARMGEIHLGAFERCADGQVHALGRERLGSPDSIALPDGQDWSGVGSGFAAQSAVLAQRCAGLNGSIDPTALPHAAAVARLAAQAFERGEALAPEHLQPTYLRDKVALTLEEQQR